MLISHNGNEYNVTDKFTRDQLLKHGATLVKESESAETTEEVTVEKKSTRKK